MNISSFYINKKSKLKQNFIYIFILTILTYFLAFSKANYKITYDILDTFLKILVPSLFPFTLLSNIIIYSGYHNLLAGSKLNYIIQKIFRLSKYSASAILFGFLFGYPNGARYINKMYEEKKISFKEAEFLLLFTNNSSPAFILSSVGIGMFGNIKIGIVLLLSHITASVLIGIIYRYKYEKYIDVENKNVVNLKEDEKITFDVVYKSIKQSLIILGIIFGFMVVFSTLHGYILKVLTYIFDINSNIKSCMLCLMEISSGLSLLINSSLNLKMLLIYISFFLGFSSMSIIFQIFSCVYMNKFKIGYIIKGKLLHGIFSSIITYILINIPHVYEHINVIKDVNYNINSSYNLNYTFRPDLVFILLLFLLYIALVFSVVCIKKKRLSKNLIISKGG